MQNEVVVLHFPNELFDRPQVQVRVQNLIIAQKLDAFLGHRGRVLTVGSVARVPRVTLARGATRVRPRFGPPAHNFLVDVFNNFTDLQEVIGDQPLAFETLVAQGRVG